jgi:hypothetical protein
MKSKQLSEHGKAFAKGGKGIPNKMFAPQAAGKAASGVTGKIQGSAPGKRAAAGGPPIRGVSLSKPAAAGRTAPPTKGK